MQPIWVKKKYEQGVISANIGVASIKGVVKKKKENHLRWFGHVHRRPESAPIRHVEVLVVKGDRRMEILVQSFGEALKKDMFRMWRYYEHGLE